MGSMVFEDDLFLNRSLLIKLCGIYYLCLANMFFEYLLDKLVTYRDFGVLVMKACLYPEFA